MTTELEIASEGKSEIVIAVIDEAYDNEDDDYEQASLLYKASLVDEFSVEFEEGNVGPGADIPAFITVLRENALPLLPWLLAVFFSGKPIVDNLGAWRQIFASVRKFFSRPVVLSRNGAAALAVEAIFDEMGGTPRSLHLRSYRAAGIWEADDFDKLTGLGVIEAAPPTIQLGMVFHVFEIEADGVTMLVGVNGRDVLIRRT